MASAWRYIVDSGIKSSQPEFLKDRLRITNIISIIIGISVGGGITVISTLYAPSIVYLPIIGASISLPVFFYNRLGLRKISRVIVSVVPCLLASAYQGFLMDVTHAPLFGIGAIMLGFATLPFVIFALQEPRALLFSLTVNILAVMLVPVYEEFLVVNGRYNYEVFATGWLRDFTVGLGVLVLFSNFLLVVRLNRKNYRRLATTLKEANEAIEALEVSQALAEESQKEAEKARVIEKGRQWVAEGNSDVNVLLRENQTDLSKSYSKLISYIVKYLGGQQGAIFVAEESVREEGKFTLRQRGGFALGKERYRGSEIQPGEGLVGTVYLDNTPSVLEKLPKDFMTISSGLGEERPVSVAIYPMGVEGRVEGVLEVYSFDAFTQVQKDFMQKVSDTIGSYIGIARVNERTKELLETSLQQAEELRAQEEEMRQNTEELMATQEEMRRKEQEYIQEIERLRKEF